MPNAERSFGFRLSLRRKIIFGYMVALAYSTVHSAPALYCTRRARARWESRPETSYGGVRPQGPHCAGICLGICWHVDGCEGVLPLIWRGDKHRRVGGFIPIRPLYCTVVSLGPENIHVLAIPWSSVPCRTLSLRLLSARTRTCVSSWGYYRLVL